MRILVISNLYPPHHAGGYELACMEMVEKLKARGHDIIVLTSTYGEGRRRSEGDVYRWLMLRFERTVHWQEGVLKEVINQAALRQVCKEFVPSVVFLWNMSHISISLAAMAHEMGLPTCYYVFDNWLATWEMDHWCQLWRQKRNGLYHLFVKSLSRRFRLIVPPFSLDMSSVVFASSYLKSVALEVGKPVEAASVVHWGIDIDNFPYQSADPRALNRLLYVGQIVPHKGIQTVIEALGMIKQSHGGNSPSFTIVGDHSYSSEYTARLKETAKKYGIDDQITFVGPVARKNLPEIYHSHDILVFPSLWEEPFGITQLEAMSSGLAVVGTGTGGSAEILEDGFNALTYLRGDAAQCARQISRLLEDGRCFNTLRRNGRKTVEKKFQIERTVDLIEKILAEAAREQHVTARLSEAKTTSRVLKTQEFETEVDRCKQWLGFVELGCQIEEILNPFRWIQKILTGAEIILGIAALPILRRLSLLPPLLEPDVLAFDAQRIHKVLVIQLGEQDRAILTSPFLRELRRFLPHAWIGLIVKPSTYSIFEKCPYLDEVLIFTGSGTGIAKRGRGSPAFTWLSAIRYVIDNLRKYRVDMAILPEWENERTLTVSHALMRLSGAPWRVGYLDAPAHETKSTKLLLEPALTYGPKKSKPKHEVENQLDILRFLGADIAKEDTEVWLSEEDHRFARHLMDNAGMSAADFIVALSAGTHDSRIQWPLDRFIQLGRWLQENYSAHLFIIANEEGLEQDLQIETNLLRDRTVNLGRRCNVRQMAALLMQCKMFIGTDSGCIHLAAAAGLSVIALVGAGNYHRFSPWGSGHEVIGSDLLCVQCGQDCIYDIPKCGYEITVDRVKRVISTKLSQVQRTVHG